jgi:hypothetical protein
MVETDLGYTLALRSYAKTLVALLRACSGVTKNDLAQHCGVSPAMVSQWLAGLRPMAHRHEHALRRLLTDAIHEQREALPDLGAAALDRLQAELMQALVDLDGAVLAMAKAYTASVRASATSATEILELTQAAAATPAVVDTAQEAAKQAYAAHAMIPGLWQALATRNRALRPLVEPAGDVRTNVADLLTYAEKIYGLEEGEALESKGPRHRRRGRPRKYVGRGVHV